MKCTRGWLSKKPGAFHAPDLKSTLNLLIYMLALHRASQMVNQPGIAGLSRSREPEKPL